MADFKGFNVGSSVAMSLKNDGAYMLDAKLVAGSVAQALTLRSGARFNGMPIFIIEKQAWYSFQGGIEDSNFLPIKSGESTLEFKEFSESESYSIGDYVIYNCKLYKVIAETQGTWETTKINYELLLGSFEEDFIKIKEWKENVDYSVDDYVLYDNAIYKCIIQHTSVVPFDETMWNKVLGNGTNVAEDILYSNSALINLDNVKDVLDEIIATVYYVKPTITSFTSTPSILENEIGTIINNITFQWEYSSDITSQTLTDCTINDKTDRATTYNSPLTSNKTFTLSATDGKTTMAKSLAFTFNNKVYYGNSLVPLDYDDNFLFALPNAMLKSSIEGDYISTVGENEYFYIAVPVVYNDSNEILGNVNNFSTSFEIVSTISHTNASGHVEDYNIYKSTNSNLGYIKFVVH